MAVIPSVHINGTSREELAGQLEAAAYALRVALDKLQDAAPNGRDYYPQGPRAWSDAVFEHQARVTSLRGVLNDIEAIWEGIAREG